MVSWRRGVRRRTILLAAFLLLAVSPAVAGNADVEAVDVQPEAGGTFRFDVTVAHADEGWDHYADQWEVLDEDGTVLATRVLAHPHVNEQPFTRSLGGVEVPDGVTHVVVRARDSVHGHGGNEVKLALPDG